MTLWDWSLQAWRRPGVETAALKRQDQGGESIALLLWHAWAGEMGDADHAAAMAGDFETRVLRSLRAARRALKSDREGYEALHGEVRAVELKAERWLLEALEKLTPEAGGDPEAGFERLDRALGL